MYGAERLLIALNLGRDAYGLALGEATRGGTILLS
jgi:hypothetical protein